jgi:hypothetical protein
MLAIPVFWWVELVVVDEIAESGSSRFLAHFDLT